MSGPIVVVAIFPKVSVKLWYQKTCQNNLITCIGFDVLYWATIKAVPKRIRIASHVC